MLLKDPDYQSANGKSRNQVVFDESLKRAKQHERNNMALSLGSDLSKSSPALKGFFNFLGISKEDEESVDLTDDVQKAYEKVSNFNTRRVEGNSGVRQILEDLADKGIDVSEVMEYGLDAYVDMADDRSDFDDKEEYDEARGEAWDNMLELLEAVDATEVIPTPAPIEATSTPKETGPIVYGIDLRERPERPYPEGRMSDKYTPSSSERAASDVWSSESQIRQDMEDVVHWADHVLARNKKDTVASNRQRRRIYKNITDKPRFTTGGKDTYVDLLNELKAIMNKAGFDKKAPPAGRITSSSIALAEIRELNRSGSGEKITGLVDMSRDKSPSEVSQIAKEALENVTEPQIVEESQPEILPDTNQDNQDIEEEDDVEIPDGLEIYEHESGKYPDRTRANIQETDATLIFAPNPDSKGTKLTVKEAQKANKPYIIIDPNTTYIEDVVDMLKDANAKHINIAGNSLSNSGMTKEDIEYFT